jgi:hypothetical protein
MDDAIGGDGSPTDDDDDDDDGWVDRSIRAMTMGDRRD